MTFRVLEDVAVPAPALPLNHPLGHLAQAVNEWVPMAVGVVDKPALSSHDLRGVALIAGQLTVAVRCLLALGPPDGTSPADDLLDAYGRAWSEAARQWTRYAVPGAADQDLPAASWKVATELRSAFVRDEGWTSSTIADVSISPFAAARLRGSIVRGLRHVGDVHYDAVLRAVRTGWVAAHMSSSSHSVDRLRTSGTGWRPAKPTDLHPLVSAYGRIARLLPREASSSAAAPEGTKFPSQSSPTIAGPPQVPRSRLHPSRSAFRR